MGENVATTGTAGVSMKVPSEVQAKSVGEVVLSWNTELENRTSFFVSKAKGLAEWDRHILTNRHQLMALQAGAYTHPLLSST
jgi:hypothetical protein